MEEIYADEVPNIDSVDKGKKKKRGPSKLNVIATGIKDRKEVEFNEFGQPIGLNSIQLSSMIGILARECVPVTHKGWDKVTSDIKDQIWEFVTVSILFLYPLHYYVIFWKKLCIYCIVLI